MVNYTILFTDIKEFVTPFINRLRPETSLRAVPAIS